MIDILHQYWQQLLWTDGYRYTGVAVTLWLLISSVVMGGLLAIPMAVARVSSHPLGALSGMVVYLCFPRYAAVRTICWCFIPVCTAWKSCGTGAAQCVFPQRIKLHHFGTNAEYLCLYRRRFSRGHSFGAARRN